MGLPVQGQLVKERGRLVRLLRLDWFARTRRPRSNRHFHDLALLPLLLAALLSCGCKPPGPRALLKGERLIQQGKYAEAVESLEVATRLLPKNAQAYNHLGLALHGNKQYAPALAAYKKALALDRKLAAAHYNLGCLQLEQNDAAAAVEELTSYTLLQPNSVEGRIKLGDALLRSRKVDAAEKEFKNVLAQYPRQPEVLNGLGVIQLQRRRPQEALTYFNLALNQNPGYGPALLNAAIVLHLQSNNRQLALERYRQYLAIQPRSANWEAVSAIAIRLDAELNPPPVHLAQATPPAPVVKSNVVSAPTNPPARTVSNRPPPVVAITPLRTNPPPTAPPPQPAPPPKIAALTNQGKTNPFVVAVAKPPVPEPVKPPVPEPVKPAVPEPIKPPPVVVVEKPPPPVVKPPEIEVSQVPDELVVKPPQEILVVRPPILPATGAPETPFVNPTNPAPLAVTTPEFKPDKRSLIARLNPFGGKPKPTTKEAPPAVSPEPSPPPMVVAARPTNVTVAPPVAPAPVIPRYTYLSPTKPESGSHKDAERFFAEGIKAQQTGRPAQALASYQKATQLDPAYFEAYYNRGLAAYGMANWKESLSDYEHALAIKPDSIDARYNFALALQQANYPLDAADELLEILNESPKEVRAHLMLGNLYARQFNQPKQARQHYLKVLEGDPHHAKAAEIRYWLAANP